MLMLFQSGREPRTRSSTLNFRFWTTLLGEDASVIYSTRQGEGRKMLWRLQKTRISIGRTLVAFLLSAHCGFGIGMLPPEASAAVALQKAPSPGLMPLPEEVVLPEQQQIFTELVSAANSGKDLPAMMAAFDAALAKLREPTKLRGFLQLARAELLLDQNEFPAAMAAVDESIRLLPGHSRPLMTAASIYGYANQPAKAADYLLRAADIDPEAARTVDDYEVNSIIVRLTAARDERRAHALADRLLQIGWVGNGLTIPSSLAASAIERRMRNGDVEGARALVPKLLAPSDSYALLAVNEYSPIWEDIERWAGPKLQKQWKIYLDEAHRRWLASRSIDTVGAYESALLTAGHYDRIILDILPLFSRKLDKDDDYDLIYEVAGVARALAYKGRWSDAEALFDQAQKVWPLGTDINFLNISMNRARNLLFAGRFDEALRRADESIAEARKWRVNADALARTHHDRACILHELDRDADAALSKSLALATEFPADAARLHLCMGDYKAARRALLEGLERLQTRKSVIEFVQKPEGALPSEYGRKLAARTAALRSDASVLARVAKYGRVLPFSLNEGAPPEQSRPPELACFSC